MKTLFFVLTFFLLGSILCQASDHIPWQPVTAKDFSIKPPPATATTLPHLQQKLNVGASMSDVVTTCGLPAARCDTAQGSPLPQRGFLMSGGIIYRDGVLAGEEDYLRYRYDLSETEKVYITTDKYQRIQYAWLETSGGPEGPSHYLIGKPNPIYWNGKAPTLTP